METWQSVNLSSAEINLHGHYPEPPAECTEYSLSTRHSILHTNCIHFFDQEILSRITRSSILSFIFVANPTTARPERKLLLAHLFFFQSLLVSGFFRPYVSCVLALYLSSISKYISNRRLLLLVLTATVAILRVWLNKNRREAHHISALMFAPNTTRAQTHHPSGFCQLLSNCSRNRFQLRRQVSNVDSRSCHSLVSTP